MKKFGLEEPQISANNDFFEIKFQGQKVRSVPGRHNSIIGKSTNLKPFLTDNEQKGLSYIQKMESQKITISQYILATGVRTRVTAKKHLDKFEEQGILKSQLIGKERFYFKKYESSI